MIQKTEHITLILLLAGSGSRFESRIPKQFLNISGDNALFIQSIQAISKYVIIDHLILVVSKKYIKSKDFLDPLNSFKKTSPDLKIDIIEGGNSRHESFLKGAVHTTPHENHVVMVHDANRPFISDTFGAGIAENIKTLSTDKSCLIPVIPSVDSLCKISHDGKIMNYLPRDNTYRIQTPQLIYAPSLEQALIKSKRYGTTTDYTDEGSFMLSMGFSVFTFPGDPGNIKITTKDDIQ